MNARLYFTTENAEPIEPIEELSLVSLKADFETDAGILPAGTRGTIVSVFGTGEAYMVEFDEPLHALATLACEIIEPVPGNSRADIVANLRAADR